MFKKISFILVLLIIMFVGNNQVLASTYHDSFEEHGMWISNEFVNKEKDGHIKYQQMTMMVRKSDNRFVYCIEPGLSIDESKIIVGNDFNQAEYANLTPQQWSRIELLAYYGYGYKDHTDIKWYVITQFMIWQTNNLGYDIYFTDRLNGNRIDKYTQEMIELDKMVNEHTNVPDFGKKDLNVFMGNTETFVDKNNVLDKYTIQKGPNISVTTNGNNLSVKASGSANSYIILQKQENRFPNKSIVYVDGTTQNLLLPGNLSDVTTFIGINVSSGKASVQKLDSDTHLSVAKYDASLENAKYGLYNESNVLLEEKNTNNDGKIDFTTKLNAGRYYIQEISPSIGYQLDQTKYYFNINKDNPIANVNVYEKIISENFEIIKVLENDAMGLLEFEKNVEFGIYDKDENLVKTYNTDELGTIKFSLDYGKYIIKQHTSYSNYEKIDDFIVEVKENYKNNKFVFADKKIKYRVILNVKNEETLENIPNIKFELYDKNDNLIDSYTTDDKGDIFFPQYFEFSEYYLKLIVDDDFIYIYDNDTLPFIVSENSEYEEVEDYRLIHLQYYLKNKPIEKEEIKDDKIEQIVELNDDIGEMIVELPNTLSNENYNLLWIFIVSLIIKKLLI